MVNKRYWRINNKWRCIEVLRIEEGIGDFPQNNKQELIKWNSRANKRKTLSAKHEISDERVRNGLEQRLDKETNADGRGVRRVVRTLCETEMIFYNKINEYRSASETAARGSEPRDNDRGEDGATLPRLPDWGGSSQFEIRTRWTSVWTTSLSPWRTAKSQSWNRYFLLTQIYLRGS